MNGKSSGMHARLKTERAAARAGAGVTTLMTIGVGEALGSKAARTFEAPRFVPVPNSRRSVTSKLAQTFAAPPFALQPGAERAGAEGRPGAPLLCAFDEAHPRETTWSTAKTLSAPLSELDRPRRLPRCPGALGAPGAASVEAPRRSPLRRPTIVTQALVAALLLVLCSGALTAGSLLWRSGASEPGLFIASTVASAPVPPAPLPREPSSAAKGDRAPAVRVAPIESATPASSSPASSSPRLEPGKRRAPGESTLARQAVDALLGGDRDRARELYREFARRAPEAAVYREAVRILEASASDAPR